MTGTLTKNTKTAYTPGTPGVPGSPGSPFIPAYTSQITMQNDVHLVQGLGTPFYVPSYFTGAEVIAWSTNPARFTAFPPTSTSTVYHPAVAAVAPTPGTPGTPAQLVHDFNIGWNSGAVSGKVLSGDCDFILSVAASSVGIVAGLNSSNEGLSYREIDHGLYFSHGKATVYESGVAKTSSFAFTATDCFTVRRATEAVTYLKNADVIYSSLIASAGAVFADSSLYMGGDAILFASFNAVGAQPDFSGATSGGSSYGALPELTGSASNKPYSKSNGKLVPLTTASTSGDLAPAYAVSAGSFAYLLGAAHGLTGETGGSGTSLLSMGSLSADRTYAASVGQLQPIGGFSTFTLPIAPGAHMDAAVVAPSPTLYATGHDSTGEQAADLGAPRPTLSVYGGANARLSSPTPKLAIAATTTNWGHAALAGPAPTVSASGTVSGTAQASLTPPMATLIGYSGAVCSITLTGKHTVQASGTAGSIGGAAIACPLFDLTASGTAQNHGAANLLAPAARLGATAQAWLIAPGATLTAIGSATVVATYEAYAINLSHDDPAAHDEVTRYTNFPFTQIVRYQGSYFGVAADGLYLLEGTTDDGEPIPWSFKTAMTDFKSPFRKTVVSAYFGGRLGPVATIDLHVGEDGATTYNYATVRSDHAQCYRQKFGRGLTAHYYALGVAGTGTLELDNIEFENLDSIRRI